MKLILFVLIISLYFLNTVQGKEASACFTGKGDRKIKGYVTFTEQRGKKDGLHVQVKITQGFAQGKKYPYHVHLYKIVNGDCNSTGTHLDPSGVGKKPNYHCNPKTPNECEAGDLSGKHGDLEIDHSGMAKASYFDRFISLKGHANGVVGRSVVIHAAKDRTTRIACADIVMGKCHV
ncbi:12365_t:CDS:2 [Cetraspora pellucida]|uniref:12365_t:CDS:1 n=1 Tax=Cetraspora pellucida TaxID=1433469 RepID=A0A9N8ZMV9_9GLOM|nr:12365_t:CDS:2 [Cetraspora pellucida]